MLTLSHLLPTKFQPPRLNNYFIPRTRLLAHLNHGPHLPLTRICAPAGYGKSTAAAQWLQAMAPTTTQATATPRRHGWIALDETDNDLNRFLGTITAALLAALDGVPPEHLPASHNRPARATSGAIDCDQRTYGRITYRPRNRSVATARRAASYPASCNKQNTTFLRTFGGRVNEAAGI